MIGVSSVFEVSNSEFGVKAWGLGWFRTLRPCRHCICACCMYVPTHTDIDIDIYIYIYIYIYI